MKKEFIILGTKQYLIYDKADQSIVDSRKWYMIVDKTGKPRVINNNGRYFHSYLIKKIDPKNVIDHINADPLDNRRVNLREITQQQNVHCRKPQENKYGYVGLRQLNGKWMAFITIDGNEKRKSFNNRKEAVIWRYNKQIEYFGEFNYEKRSLEEVLKYVMSIEVEDKPDNKFKKCDKVYFKRPKNKTNFPAIMVKDDTDYIVYYGKDNYALNRFKGSKKYQYALTNGWEWE